VIGEREVLDTFLPAQGGYIVVQILTECPIGKSKKFEVQPFHTLSEQLELAQEAKLLKFDVI
jgi:hypothetical protein